MKIKLQKVHYMPQQLEPGILYVSYEFGTAAHLCACGCGAKIRTPLGPTEWSIEETSEGPSLWPSVGNWQQACKSHYVISRGEILWADRWSDKRIAAGRKQEQMLREEYYKAMYASKEGVLAKLLRWVMRFFS
ncbi:DUF6527 family protein [Methylomicrobium lacus]|uniref:DUF6527 family protein n=1 Tax=Methylomicrobium lacus TaxID=136992 RepID=UPI0035A84286